jgi:hypothetical protein
MGRTLAGDGAGVVGWLVSGIAVSGYLVSRSEIRVCQAMPSKAWGEIGDWEAGA